MADNAGQGPYLRQRVIGYARVSTEGQGKSGIGIDIQKAAIEAFADKLEWELIQIFEDVASGMGSRSAKNRVGLQKALSAAKENDANIIVHDWSRLSRDTATFDVIAAKFPDPDRIISVLQGSTLGDASAAGQHAYAQKQGEAISKATQLGMAKKREQGAVFGNPAILDVQRTGTAAASEKATVLARQIADVLIELDAVESTRSQVIEILNDRGILTGQGKQWDESRIRLPLKKARELIAEDKRAAGDADYASNPNYGLF